MEGNGRIGRDRREWKRWMRMERMEGNGRVWKEKGGMERNGMDGMKVRDGRE